MNNFLIQIKDLHKKFQHNNNSFYILKKINFNVKKSEVISITGPSGVGKTTLLNIVGLLDSYNSGKYFFNNSDVNNLNIKSKNKFRNEFIGFVHQFFHLIPELSVIENVALPSMIMGQNKEVSFSKAEFLLNKFGLQKRKYFKPSILSGGEQQRVSIARALINKPKLIIADEMTGNLDEKNSNDIFNFFIKTAVLKNQTIIYVTHNLELANKAKKKYKLENGFLEKYI